MPNVAQNHGPYTRCSMDGHTPSMPKSIGVEPNEKIWLNLGCGFRPRPGFVNVDKYDNCDPDVVHDLNVFPYPWEDESVDGIIMWHVLEHLDDWWAVFLECVRILRPGAVMQIRVPDATTDAAITYRDHYHIFDIHSFHGIRGRSGSGTNAGAELISESVPIEMVSYERVPYTHYRWMTHWPFQFILRFCASHLRNFFFEQRFLFVRVGDSDGQ